MKFSPSIFVPGAAVVLASQAASVIAAGRYEVYHAVIDPIPGVVSDVMGKVIVFADTQDGSTVGYGGYVDGLEPLLDASNCNATNGCGVHIHSGTGCEDSAAQGGHYFADPVSVDPWIKAQYSSDADGSTMNFSNMLQMGTIDLEGRAFVVHKEDGSRVGCGLLERVEEGDLLEADLAPFGEAIAEGGVSAIQVDGTDMICYMGYTMGLEANLFAFYSNEEGSDCSATNGCGTHVHAGTDCSTTGTQMGHYYNAELLGADPWAIIGYDFTTSDGMADYMDCIRTGETSYEGRAFVIHANDGSRVACGLLETPSTTDMVEPTENIAEIAAGAGSFETLVAALGAAGLVETVSAAEATLTVFAPTDDAFASLPAGLVDCLLLVENKEALTAILTYHVLGSVVKSTDLMDGMTTATVQGESITVNLTDGAVKVNQANVVSADIMATNGVIHAIDAVIVPPSIDVEAFLATCPTTVEATEAPENDSAASVASMTVGGFIASAAAAMAFSYFVSIP